MIKYFIEGLDMASSLYFDYVVMLAEGQATKNETTVGSSAEGVDKMKIPELVGNVMAGVNALGLIHSQHFLIGSEPEFKQFSALKPYSSNNMDAGSASKAESKTTLRSLMMLRIKELSNDREKWIKSIPVGMKMNNMGAALTKTLSIAQKTFFNQSMDAIDSDVVMYVNEQMYTQLITNTDTSKFNNIKDETLKTLKVSDNIVFDDLTLSYTCVKLKAVIYDLIVNYNMMDFFNIFKQELIAGTKNEPVDEKYVNQHLGVAQMMLPETFFSNTLEEAKQPNLLNNLFKLRLMYDVMDAYITVTQKIKRFNTKEALDSQTKPVIDFISNKLEMFTTLDDVYGSSLTDRIIATMIDLRSELINATVPVFETFDNPLAMQISELDSFINAMKQSTSNGYNDYNTQISFRSIDTNLLSVNQLSPHLIGLFWKWKRTIMQDNLTNQKLNVLSSKEEEETYAEGQKIINEVGKPGYHSIKRKPSKRTNVSKEPFLQADISGFNVSLTPEQMIKIASICETKDTIEAAGVNEDINKVDMVDGKVLANDLTSTRKNGRNPKLSK